MPGAAENHPGETSPQQFGFDLGAAGEQQLFLRFPGQVPVEVAAALHGLAGQFDFTVRNVTPQRGEQSPEPLQNGIGWWEVEPAALQNVSKPLVELELPKRFLFHLARAGAATLQHVLCFGRNISDWDNLSGFGAYAHKSRGQLAELVAAHSPFPWLEAPTIQDIARMCPTTDDVWAGCLANMQSLSEPESWRNPPRHQITPRDFTTNDKWLSVGEVVRSPRALPDFLTTTSKWEGDALSDRLAQAADYTERARAFQAAFEFAQQEIGIA